MKKLLYIAFNNNANQLFGVNAKIKAQCRAFAEYGYEVERIERCGADTVVARGDEEVHVIKAHKERIRYRYVRSVVDKQNQIRDIVDYVKGKAFDACYIRYDFSDHGFIHLLKQLRKVCAKMALELPTYPYEDENRGTWLSRVKLGVDMFYRRQLHRYVDFIVTFYAGYDQLFGIPVLTIPNGFDFSTFSLVQEKLPEDGIHVIAVSSMREWHGYERMIEGMHDYVQNGLENRRRVILHLVGNGREYGKYKELIERYGLQESIVLEGAMHGEKLDALYERCALGVDSLARHRSGIDVLSSLKSREYGAKGIAMINSCKIDILDEGFPYLLRVPADETPIDIEQIIRFYDRCFCSGKSRREVGEAIRSYVEARSGMKQTLARVVQLFDE